MKALALCSSDGTDGQVAVAAPRISRPRLVAAWSRAGLSTGYVLGVILGGGFGATIGGILFAIVGVIIGGVIGALIGLVVGTLDGLVLASLASTPVLGPTAGKRARWIRTRWIAATTIVFLGLAAQLALSGNFWDPHGDALTVYVPAAAGALRAAVISGKLPPSRTTRRVRATSASTSRASS